MRVGVYSIACEDEDEPLNPDHVQYVARSDARQREIDFVLNADPEDDNGRSQFQWFRLPNGDLILGVFPQGDTYLNVIDGGVDV